MQHCDSTCDHCAREFFAWWRARAYAGRRREGRSGAASFDAESVTSRHKDLRARAELALRALRACWVIVSAQHVDAVGDGLERMGKELAAAIEAEDWDACNSVIGQARADMQQFGGVLMSRCEHVFRER